MGTLKEKSFCTWCTEGRGHTTPISGSMNQWVLWR